MKKRALISVSDKTGIIETAKKLDELGYEIISTGGTFKAIKEAGINAINISDVTGFPECLDGRVKTLHPAVHAGLLAIRNNEEHMKQITELGINTIDVVIVNLYPFKKTIMKEGIDFQEAVENIDIGGPTMLRSAAKNFQDVIVIVDPKDYEKVFSELETGFVGMETRKYLMYKVFQHTAVYDSMISTFLRKQIGIDFPEQLTLAFEKKEQMRYGENPHQNAASYSEAVPIYNSLVNAEFLNGKALSYNNINDTNGAVELLKEFYGEPTVVAVKHANPCGVATAGSIYEAYFKAYEADPVSIYGGIVACNGTVDQRTANEMVKIFLEIVIAPDYTDEALEVLRTKKNLRVLKLKDVGVPNPKGTMEFKKCYGGLIFQDMDFGVIESLDTVTEKEPTEQEKKTMEFAMKVVKHCKSNAIVIARDGHTEGIGVGQTNRIWATKQAVEHSKDTKGAVLASDAFFPFNDCVYEASKAGITAIVQPGGSIRDEDSIKACNELGIAMSFSGTRHFKH
ncbi:MAG: Bifunctional purine biosynthesis protein PurH [Firmicutes bacterium ADurb.Bin080]|nr:MAG: Bifunctional purine biosynthesis protein PurH [Firmicutes bacterium ADurb.Bin080]